MARNLKLFNHWIAELRDLAAKKNLRFVVDDNKTKPMSKSDIKYVFNLASMGEPFNEGLDPKEALENELECWD